jgi:uncharacterized protein
MRNVAIIVLICAALTRAATAEPYPQHRDSYVNDYADVIAPDAESRLRAELQGLKTETGIEVTVLTIPSRADYDAAPTIEAFAQGVFNDWGVGDKTRNDGILVLVAKADREMRLQLGSAYDQGYDVLAQDIVSRYITPEFRDGLLSEGIEKGVTETIARIARPHAARLPAAQLPAAPRDIAGWLIGGSAAALIALLALRRRIGNAVAGFRPCPQCGKRGLHRHSEIISPSSDTVPGLRRDITTCSNCSYADRRDSRIPIGRSKASSGGSFGGGKSSGGGATGRW